MKDYYKILNVDSQAKFLEIKTAYRKLSLQLHPDVNASDSAVAEFSEVSEAYNVLKDAVRRKKYDVLLAQNSSNKQKTRWEQKVNNAAEKGRRRGYKNAKEPIEVTKSKNSSRWDWGFILELLVNLIFG